MFNITHFKPAGTKTPITFGTNEVIMIQNYVDTLTVHTDEEMKRTIEHNGKTFWFDCGNLNSDGTYIRHYVGKKPVY